MSSTREAAGYILKGTHPRGSTEGELGLSLKTRMERESCLSRAVERWGEGKREVEKGKYNEFSKDHHFCLAFLPGLVSGFKCPGQSSRCGTFESWRGNRW